MWITFCIILILISSICYFLGYEEGVFEQVMEQRKNKAEQKWNENFSKQSEIIRQENIPLENYFINRKMKRIAVYGLDRYYFELLDNFDVNRLETIYLGDRNKKDKQELLSRRVYTIDELVKESVDAVLVTSVAHYDEIRREFEKKGMECPMISYQDLVYNAKKEV